MQQSENQQTPAAKSEALWQKTNYSNLVRYVPSGSYFARLRVKGKLHFRSLKTKTLSVAKLKLADFEKAERGAVENQTRLEAGAKVTFQDLKDEYLIKLDANPAIKPRSKDYRRECLARLEKTWPELAKLDARRIGKGECESWAAKFVKLASPSSYNNTIGTLKQVLDIAVERGIRYLNPAAGIKRTKVRLKKLALPSLNQFPKLVEEIRRVPYGPGLASADLVEFMAYGGFRKGEAQHVTWADCDFKAETILVRGHPVTGTKSGEARRVPMIADMKRLLEGLADERPDRDNARPVMRVAECQGALTRASKALGIPRITHHDLRHLFATRCIESGVDIPTVSRWLGHKDGGALAMKVYGHLRDEHSVAMAQKVTFRMQSSASKPEAAILTQ